MVAHRAPQTETKDMRYTPVRADERKRIKWQHRMARVQENSKTREKAKAAACRESFGIVPRRKATVHNITVGIVQESSNVACEDVQVAILTRKGTLTSVFRTTPRWTWPSGW